VTLKPLSEVLADGTVVDNTVHTVDSGWFRRGEHRDWFELKEGKGWNHPKNTWPILRKAAALNVESHAVVRRGDDYEHNTDDRFVQLNGYDTNQFTITTGNLIGCVKEGDYTLRISSRFGNEFLKFIIADADGFVEVPDQGGNQHGGYDWLLIYFWTIKLKKAYRLGLPKSYEARTEQLTLVRGRLDPFDFMLNADRARYRCAYREHSYDNDITRLITRTLQHLAGHEFLRDTHGLSQTFQIATHGRRHELRDLLASKPVRNPYYADYDEVITLSKRILRNELSDFGDRSQTSAFFFDVSMLFEYFVRKLLQRGGAEFRDKNSQNWYIPTGVRIRSLIPDLVFELEGKTFVFDVKYKSFDFREGVRREDLFQLHTYLGQLTNHSPVAGCGFIYPVSESRWQTMNLAAVDGILTDTIEHAGQKIPFHVAFIRVPEDAEVIDEGQASTFRDTFRLSIANFSRAFFRRVEGWAGQSHNGFIGRSLSSN
jgi:5-methylcytosine-specific restriction enzyme subunit McrC